MKAILPALLVDGYKVGHVFQYPQDTEFEVQMPSNLPGTETYGF